MAGAFLFGFDDNADDNARELFSPGVTLTPEHGEQSLADRVVPCPMATEIA